PSENHHGASFPPVPIFHPSSIQILYRIVHRHPALLFQNSVPTHRPPFWDNLADLFHPSSDRNKAGICRDIVSGTTLLNHRIHHPLLRSGSRKFRSLLLPALSPNQPKPF